MWAVWLFGFIAVLFNPLIPIHLSREIWQPVDIVCGILFMVIAIILSESVTSEGKKEELRGKQDERKSDDRKYG